MNFDNLDAIISVGYRVNSTQATQFRIWATQTLREFIGKRFVLDDERLKLFDVDVDTISYHLKRLHASSEPAMVRTVGGVQGVQSEEGVNDDHRLGLSERRVSTHLAFRRLLS